MTHKSYDKTYKRNAVSLVESGTPAAQVARDLGISAHLIYTCRSQYGTKPTTHGNAKENQDEVTLLRKQLARSEAELDI